MNYELNPALRRFVIFNNSIHNISVSFAIIPRTNDFLNFRLPSTVTRLTVEPKKSMNLLTVMKIFPEMGWGEFDIWYNVE